MTHASAEPVTFVVTDIETDGHSPLRNSMISFASVAVGYDGVVIGEFEANLLPRADRVPDPRTAEWWRTQPEAWAAATANPEPAETVMPRFADWVEALPGQKVFAAAPIMFDGPFIDHYLDTYAGTRALGGPYTGRQLFRGGGVCLYTMAGTLRGADYLNWGMQRAPAEWYGNIPHTHKAIDDARGFANVLVRLFEMNADLPLIQATTGVYQ
ncbi:MAG TPA: 3'-5' exoribonuclease [Devosiaceae bacterium]